MQGSAGFTKIELLVACVCLVVLLALLLPAMQAGNGGSRRSLCEMRLAELGKATIQYEMANGRYPGTLNAYGKDEEGLEKVGTWAVAFLPYLESETTYALWADPNTTGQWSRRGGGTSVMNSPFYPKKDRFICPADANRGDGLSPNSYAVNAGFFPDTLPPDYEGLDPHEIARRSSRPANGVFSNQLPLEMECVYTKYTRCRILGSRADAPTRASDIRDGLTNTIAIAESINADGWGQVGHSIGWDRVEIDGVTYAGDDLNLTWSPRTSIGVVWQYRAQPSVSGVPDYAPPSWPSNTRKRSYPPSLAIPSSYHVSGFNCVMLGGSATNISRRIDYRVLQALMTPETSTSDAPDKSLHPTAEGR